MNHLQVHTVVERVLSEVDVLKPPSHFRTKVNRNWTTVLFKNNRKFSIKVAENQINNSKSLVYVNRVKSIKLVDIKK